MVHVRLKQQRFWSFASWKALLAIRLAHGVACGTITCLSCLAGITSISSASDLPHDKCYLPCTAGNRDMSLPRSQLMKNLGGTVYILEMPDASKVLKQPFFA